MLTSVRREYDEQQELAAAAVDESLRKFRRGSRFAALTVQQYQAEAVMASLAALPAILGEQGIDPGAESTVAPAALLTDVAASAAMIDNTDSEQAFARLVQTLVVDASRTARAVDMTTRRHVTGYVRSLRTPSCSRCAVLAGRVYRYSEGFQRHPKCDCVMTPTTDRIGPDLVTDPMEAFRNGQIRNSRIDKVTGERIFSNGLTKADVEAVNLGADLGQVVNVRRKAAGLTVGSSVTVRAGRLTPQGCLNLASDRTEALGLLKQFGYIL